MCNDDEWSYQPLPDAGPRTVWAALPRRGSRMDSSRLRIELSQALARIEQLQSLLVQTQEGERAARYLASHDALTTLPNRRAFLENLDHVLQRANAQGNDLAVLFLDLDHFKWINDTYGHAVGDQLLSVVGRRLALAVRSADFAARLGGDEFACLLSNAPSSPQMEQVAIKLFESIAAPIQLGTLRLQVQPSIGIAVRRNAQSTDSEQLMVCADRAMYHAKHHRCRFHIAYVEVPGTG